MKTSTFEKQSISSLQLPTSLQRYAIVASNIPNCQQILQTRSSNHSVSQRLPCIWAYAPLWSLSSSQTVEMSICSWLQESPSLASSTIHISAGSGAWSPSGMEILHSSESWSIAGLQCSFHGLIPLKAFQLPMENVPDVKMFTLAITYVRYIYCLRP